MSVEEKKFRRLNYCGTCKTIGALYGQKSRFLLNHDTVFLAEILTALSGENVADRHNSYQSYNCLNLPTGELPQALQFAATINVALTEFKLADHVADEEKRRYKYAQKLFSKEFRIAERLLKEWDFPLERVREILGSQKGREAANASLEDLAEPTALATAEFFAHGALLIGKGELKSSLFEIGYAFGKLIYVLDAFEDYERDFRTNQFNALRAVYESKENKLSDEIKRRAARVLNHLESEISRELYELPIADDQKRLFAARLQSNLQRKLKTELPVLKTKGICQPKRPKQTLAQKWKNASGTARGLAGNYSWQMPLVFLFVFAFALIAPAQTREARSARECFDLSFNLMFLGGVLGAVFAPVRSIFLENPEELLTKEGRKKKLKKAARDNSGSGDGDGSGWCDWCDCECCCCCDGCECGCCGDNCCCDCSCD
jgi:hypothetical protein